MIARDDMAAEHIDADWSYLLDPDQELETIELGDRVGWWLTMWLGASIYAEQAARELSAVGVLVAEVAEMTSHRGLVFPTQWWPADMERLTP